MRVTITCNFKCLLLRLIIISGCLVLMCMSESNIHPRVHIDPNYNIHEAPVRNNGQPIDVNFTINLRNILEVNEVAQLISLETSIRLFWVDWRVRADLPQNDSYMTLNPIAAKHFWIPDIFIDRSKSLRVPTFYVKPASLRIYRDQTLRYSSRVNFDVACIMDFHKFPVDEQLCEINFESFGHTNAQLNFQWVKGSNFNKNITLAQFTWEVRLKDSYQTAYYDLSYPGRLYTFNASYIERQFHYLCVVADINYNTIIDFILFFRCNSKNSSSASDWISCNPDLYSKFPICSVVMAITIHFSGFNSR